MDSLAGDLLILISAGIIFFLIRSEIKIIIAIIIIHVIIIYHLVLVFFILRLAISKLLFQMSIESEKGIKGEFIIDFSFKQLYPRFELITFVE